MRRVWAVAVVGVALLLVWPLAAEPPGNNFFVGMQPRPITNKTIDVTRLTTPKPGVTTAGFYRKTPSLAFPSLTGFLPKLDAVSPLTWASRRVAAPTTLATSPYQPNPPKK